MDYTRLSAVNKVKYSGPSNSNFSNNMNDNDGVSNNINSNTDDIE